VLGAQLQEEVMVAEEVMELVLAVVLQEVEQMAVPLVLLEQAEQAFHSQFLATMEEIPKHMLQVAMAE
jgi:hypothetical protein